MRKIFALLSLLIVASMALAACGGGAPSATQAPTDQPAQPAATTAPEQPAATEAPAYHGTLRVNLGTFPDMMDPQKSSFVNEIAVLQMVYEGLTRLNGDLETVPAAAESWKYNGDATELVFTLRKGLTYSDGSMLNAARYEYSLHRNIDPATAGEYASITNDIAGAADWNSCTENCDDKKAAVMETVKASHADGAACTGYDDAACDTLTLKFTQPAPYFHTVASLWVTYPAKQELIEAGGEDWWLDSDNHVGNGPFVMTNLEQGVNVHFAPNEVYWAGVPSYDLDYSFITDGAVAFEAYKNNELDINGLAAEDLATVQADPVLSKEAYIYPGSCSFAMMYHQLKAPFNDPKVREAFSYALDRDAWVTDVLKGLGSSTLTWIPKGFPGYKDGETRWGYDPAKAVQTLTDAGYKVEGGKLIGPDGKAIEITDTFSDTPRNRTRNEWLVAKWKEVLGIDIKLDPVESTTYTALTKDINTAPQMYILGWCADYPDPQNWLSVYWKTGAFGQRIGYSNPDLDALLTQADGELDPAKRADLYQQAQDMLVAGVPVSFMWNNVNTYMVKPWVTNINKTPMDFGWIGSMDPLSVTVSEPTK
ncbi:MAG: peptide ABC transporter substrate-binding protein [Anaerolineales bacterium]|nr:peptide ABC transporter substrate-binding protein [Anaerolineales bacterium]